MQWNGYTAWPNLKYLLSTLHLTWPDNALPSELLQEICVQYILQDLNSSKTARNAWILWKYFNYSIKYMKWTGRVESMERRFFVIPFYLQSVLVHLANCIETYTMACGRVLSSALLYIPSSRPLVVFYSEAYELSLIKLELQIRQLH
jgi:hypothetical protein